MQVAFYMDSWTSSSITGKWAKPGSSADQKTEELVRARMDRDTWLPEAREAKLSPVEYMDRCNRFLCKLDTMGWKRSFHQNLFHAASCRALDCSVQSHTSDVTVPSSARQCSRHLTQTDCQIHRRTSSGRPRAPSSRWRSRARSPACTRNCSRRTTIHSGFFVFSMIFFNNSIIFFNEVDKQGYRNGVLVLVVVCVVSCVFS